MITFAAVKLSQQMEKYNTISKWVGALPKAGKNFFTQNDVEKQFSAMNVSSIRNALYRLSRKGTIQSVWHGFYVIVLPEYGFKGVVPPTEYIDQLMKYLGREYYVGLLNAAAFQGAAHQQPQTFSVVVDTNNLRGKIKKGVKINFVAKKHIPVRYVKQLTTRNGYINISIPELTALDLLLYAREIGGINRASTILNELAEVMDFENIESDFLRYFNSAVIQRLGYILDDVLEYKKLADTLYQKATEAGIKFRKYPLKVVSRGSNFSGYCTNEKWKIIINEEIDIDE
ncbi:MAG: type IV toxin-antitoxin system AbiEi family antitoxin [Bacteroidales bacterium]|jgi:predicted transcriptional regulator of viral defense system|nr:type IV toxin-antitoxin system AbiEi family antitoxin [Bacteroidales bacterium]